MDLGSLVDSTWSQSPKSLQPDCCSLSDFADTAIAAAAAIAASTSAAGTGRRDTLSSFTPHHRH